MGIRFLTRNSCVESLLILCFAYRSHFPVCDNSVHFPAESRDHSGAPSGVNKKNDVNNTASEAPEKM